MTKTCECIVQSGERKGSKCGRKISAGSTCGLHKKTCKQPEAKKSPPSSPKTLNPKVVKYINNMIVDESLDELTVDDIQRHIQREIGAEYLKARAAYNKYIANIFERKIKILNSNQCQSCVGALARLRIN